MAKDDFEDFLSKITFAESRGKRTDSSGKLLEGPMTKYGTAKGELQVLDSTNKKPGYGVVAAKDETPDERARVGRDYLKAMLDKFKDKRTAAIAYNWGPGNTQKWLDAGADEAGLPQETQNYVKKVMGTEVAKAPAPPDMAPAPRQAAGAPSVPVSRPTVSRETQAGDRLSALGPSYQAAMALSFLGDTTNPAPQEDDEDELRISGDESRSAAREDDDVTQFLTGPSARSALADFDFKIQSPFAERVAAASPVNRAKGSPEEGEISQEEIEAASKPSFRAQSSGMNRQKGPISDALNSGEAYTAAAKGLTNLPYNIAGGAMDLAMLARQGLTGQAPAGQVGTSEFIKNKMTELGIRQPPPTDPTLKGFYELGDLGSNLVNPAAPVRGAVKVAEKTGEAAKMLAKDLGPIAVQMGEGYLQRQGLMPGIVRPSGGFFPATKPADAIGPNFEPISRIDHVFAELRKGIENKTGGSGGYNEAREASLKFVNNKLLDYFRTKAGSVGDPVREALITGKIKIPKNSQLEEDFPQALIDAAKKGDVTAMVAIERKLDDDLGIKSFRKKQDNEPYDQATQESQKFTDFILQQMKENPGTIPDSLLLRLAKKDESKMAPGEAAALIKKMRQDMADNPNYFSLRLEPGIQRMIVKSKADFPLESVEGSHLQTYGHNIYRALKGAEKTKEGIMALTNNMPITDISYKYPSFKLLGIEAEDIPKIITKINPEELGRMGVPEFLNAAIKIKNKTNEFETIEKTLVKFIDKKDFNFPKEISLYGTQPFLETGKGFTWREVTDPDATTLQGKMMDNSIGGYSRVGTYGAVSNGRAALEKKDVRIFSLYGPENTPLVNAEYITPSYVRKVDPSTGNPKGPLPNSFYQITGNGTRTKNATPEDYGLPILELMKKLGTDKIPYGIQEVVNRLPPPPSSVQLRAKGGFMERESNDNRKYL